MVWRGFEGEEGLVQHVWKTPGTWWGVIPKLTESSSFACWLRSQSLRAAADAKYYIGLTMGDVNDDGQVCGLLEELVGFGQS